MAAAAQGTLGQFLPDPGAMRGALANADQAALTRAIDRQFRGSLDRMLSGIEAYRRHPYRRRYGTAEPVWTSGTTRLYRHGKAASEQPGGQPGVLLVPSLVNRAYIMDLLDDVSFCRHLADAGLAVFLLDWGAPGAGERDLSLEDYTLRLEAAAEAAVEAQGGPVSLVGYCMGGLLALPVAIRRPDLVARLVLMATPWDFHADLPRSAREDRLLLKICEPAIQFFGCLPVDVIQALFTALDPLLAFKKFQDFAAMDQQSGAARRFVALEDWLNDGVPLTAAVARETLGLWYGDNATAEMTWRLGGEVVDPAAFRGESLVVIPRNDRIVPPASALAITEHLGDVRLLRPPLGHIGMMASRHAADLWTRIARFVAD